MSLLSIKNLNYSYENSNVPVLQNINLGFDTGKMYAIRGKSGAGKTTLLSLISGLNKYTQGNILYDDKEITGIDKEKYRSQDIGVVFQSFNLLLHLTAIENVILSMEIAKSKISNTNGHALDILKKVELTEEKSKRRILELSGGEQQRVAITRALSYNPSIIIADEPTGNLDQETENQVLTILKTLAHQDQKCGIVVTHSQTVAEACDVVHRL